MNPYLDTLQKVYGAAAARRFIPLAEQVGPDAAFYQITHDKTALASIKRQHNQMLEVTAREEADASAIQDAIEKANKQMKIETNPVIRIREKTARHNALVAKMKGGVLINGTPVDDSFVGKAELTTPAWARGITTHTATASHKDKPIKLAVSWTF